MQSALSIFRIYEPHELKNGRYPFAWDHLTCPECHGAGERGFNPSPINDPQCADSARCGPCQGDGSLDYGIKDLVREEAGHRCVRCGHPYRVGESGVWSESPRSVFGPLTGGSMLHMVERTDDLAGLERMQGWEPPRGRQRPVLWSPCDEHCTHEGPIRFWDRRRACWAVVRSGVTPDRVVSGEVQAAWRILTVHHLNERKFDCRWHNLVSLCQRCHLTIQRKVEMNQVFPFEHSAWFKPYAAAFYAYSYLGQELTREQTMERLDELLGLELIA